jgi:hypothetical protein
MRHLMSAIVAAALLGGCASYAWVRPDGATPTLAATEDERFCRTEASNVVQDVRFSGFGTAYTPGAPWHWPWVGAPGYYGGPDLSWQLAAEQRVYDRCMRAKGYELVRVERERAR